MTNRLTVERSTTELLRNMIRNFVRFIIAKKKIKFSRSAIITWALRPKSNTK